MALNRSDKSRILRRYFPGMTRNSEMSTEPRLYLQFENLPWPQTTPGAPSPRRAEISYYSHARMNKLLHVFVGTIIL